MSAGDDFLLPGDGASATPADAKAHVPGSNQSRKSNEPAEPDVELLQSRNDGNLKGGDAADLSAPGRSNFNGFTVDFKAIGQSASRATYDSAIRTIYINLDHPQIVAAQGTAHQDDPTFGRLTYEVACAEYAIALAQELANRGQYFDLTDPIVEIRATIDRLARKSARLYVA